jgi:hypothetical protein
MTLLARNHGSRRLSKPQKGPCRSQQPPMLVIEEVVETRRGYAGKTATTEMPMALLDRSAGIPSGTISRQTGAKAVASGDRRPTR